MTRTAREEMKLDAKKAKVCDRLVRELHISASESKKIVDGLIAKYGDRGFEVITTSLQRPYDALKAIGEKGRSSRLTLKFFLEKNLTSEQLKKALSKENVRTKSKLRGEMKDDAAKAKTGGRALSGDMAARQQKLDTKTKNTPAPKPRTAAPTPKPRTTAPATRARTASPQAVKVGQAWSGEAPRAASGSTDVKYTAWRPQTAEERALETFEKAAEGNVSGTLTFDELIKKAGVTKADFQALINQQETIEGKGELIASVIPGRTRQAFAKEADDVSGRCGGKCLTGVQNMAVRVYGSDAASPICGARDEWRTDVDKAKGDNANSACNAHVLFDNVGKGLTVTVPNLAYGERARSQGDKRMKEFNDKLPGGTIASTSHKRNEKGYAANKSARHGHIWVKDHHGNSCSDGVQKNGPKDFNAYGPDVYVTLFKDDYVLRELALDLIKQAQQRQDMEQQKLQQKQASRQG